MVVMMTKAFLLTLMLALLMLAPVSVADETGAADTGYHTFRGELRPLDVDNNMEDCGTETATAGDRFYLDPAMAGKPWSIGTQDPAGTYSVAFYGPTVHEKFEGVRTGVVPVDSTKVAVCKVMDADAVLDHGLRVATYGQAESYSFSIDMDAEQDVLEFRSVPEVNEPLSRDHGCEAPTADRLPIHAAMHNADWRLSRDMVLTFVDSDGGRTIVSGRTLGTVPEDAQEVLICSPYYLTEFSLTITYTV